MSFDFKKASPTKLEKKYRQIAKKTGDIKAANRKELRKLSDLLLDGEQVFLLATGKKSGALWLIALTEKRLILTRQDFLLGLQRDIISLASIEDIKTVEGFFRDTLIIRGGKGERIITHIAKPCLKSLAAQIREAMARFKMAEKGGPSIYEELERIQRLKESGALTEAEFEEHKSKIMAVSDMSLDGSGGSSYQTSGDSSGKSNSLGVWMIVLACIIFFSFISTFAGTDYTVTESSDEQFSNNRGSDFAARPEGPVAVSEESFAGLWPLTVPSGAISCVSSSAVLFRGENGGVYAINETAQELFAQLPDVSEILLAGRSPESLVEYGLSLCADEPVQAESSQANDAISYDAIRTRLRAYHSARSGKTAVQRLEIDELRSQYVDNLTGQFVVWNGWIDDVQSRGNGYQVYIDMDDPSTFFSLWNVTLTTRDDSVAEWSKDTPVTLGGVIESVAGSRNITVTLAPGLLKRGHGASVTLQEIAAIKQQDQELERDQAERARAERQARRAEFEAKQSQIDEQGSYAYGACKEAIKNALGSPRSISFPWMNWNYRVLGDQERAVVSAHVNTRNQYNTRVRTNFECRARYLGDSQWIVENINTY